MHTTDTEKKLIAFLFETQALRAAPENQPFWYTSGSFGPYYINTHFFFGDAQAAQALLAEIDDRLAQREALLDHLARRTAAQYQRSPCYQLVIDALVDRCRGFDADMVSGGERRDFFFSPAVADRLHKPHVSLFKDRTAWLSAPGQRPQELAAGALAGARILHVSDLVTEASSYQRAWLPAIQTLGARVEQTLTVIDRQQGGRQLLAAAGVQLQALLTIEPPLFQLAAGQGFISQGQLQQIEAFTQDPAHYQAAFVAAHPQFIDQELAAGGDRRVRALRFMARDKQKPTAKGEQP